ncbi:hypothetical protein [Photobacterium halotolerans]|uniref:Uncharacterized protein n=1 Tax=Photobacterium halotolerans TaxID=265726 RepID=A0A7X5AS39_9GAMM|nr:hypothetical protein [Photobacterium halotolerans]NAW63976.1 hypothetical protein [Photobacterium halotolerans]
MNEQQEAMLLALRGLAVRAAIRHVAMFEGIENRPAIKLIAEHCNVLSLDVVKWREFGVPSDKVDLLLELLNRYSPWARHQLRPRVREADIWLRVEAAQEEQARAA